MAQADGSIIIDTRIDETGLTKGLHSMKNAVVAGMAAITAAIGAASVAVIALGSEFEQANAKASTLFGDAQVDMSQYQGKMLELSTKTGLAATELGNTMYDALSAGIPASDDMSEAIGFLEKNTKLAKAGFTDINTATTATAKVLNAYKMDVSETDRVHKVLMQTQNKGITTVNELGSVLSQVTPTASAMGVSFEQVGAALANMTAQGTPTAQATTQLNGLIAELGKNGTIGAKSLEKAAKGTEYAGKSFSELMKEGVPLNEILDLMANYADKNNLSMIDMFSSIEAGKAALAVSGQNSQQFTDNLKAMGTEVDVVGEAYEKVTDTFKEKSEKVVNSLKNVGIQAYSKFEKPLKKSMDAAQKSVDELARDMSRGQLGKSVDKIADAFSGLVDTGIKLASKAIPLLVNGFGIIVDHGEELTVALVAVSGAMAAMKAADFSKTSILPMIESFTRAKQAAMDFAYAQQASVAFGVEMNGTLSLGQAAIGLLSGQIDIATAKQVAWNTVKAMDPTMILVAAVGALVAGIAVLSLTMDDEVKHYREVADSIKENTEAFDELKAKQEEQVTANLSEIDHTKRLSEELSTLVDANGKVKEGYEGRASFILGELNSALGTEYEMTDGIIQKYDEMKTSIADLMDVQRAQIILESEKEAYTEAINNRTQALTTLNEIEKEYAEIKQANDAKIIELQSERDEAIRRGDEITFDSVNSKISALQLETTETEKNYNDQLALVNSYNGTISRYEADLAAVKSENVEQMEAMNARYANSYVVNGETINLELQQMVANEKANLNSLQMQRDEAMNIADEKQRAYEVKALDNQIQASQNALDQMMLGNEESLSKYGNYIQEKLSKSNDLKIGLSNNEKGITQDMVTEAQKQTVQSLIEYGNYVNEKNRKALDLQTRLKNNEEGITQDMVDEARNQAEKASAEFAQVSKNVTDAMDDLPEDTRKIFGNMVQPMYDEMEKAKPSLWQQANNIATGILGNLQKAFDIHSPSRKTKEIFKNVMLGAEKGLENERDNLLKQTDGISNEIQERFKDIDISSTIRDMQSAIYGEQMKMASTVDVQAKSELLKTNVFKQDNRPLTASITGNQIIKLIVDGREMCAILAPYMDEELAFR